MARKGKGEPPQDGAPPAEGDSAEIIQFDPYAPRNPTGEDGKRKPGRPKKPKPEPATPTDNELSKLVTEFVHRIEFQHAEKKEIADTISDIYAEAHGRGLSKKALKVVIKRRAMDRADRLDLDAMVSLYEEALGD